MRPMLAAILMAGTALPAMASSEEAWEQFANDVRTACVAAAAPLIEDPHALVDPHGSEHFGLALMRGKAKGAETEVAVICEEMGRAATRMLIKLIANPRLEVERVELPTRLVVRDSCRPPKHAG